MKTVMDLKTGCIDATACTNGFLDELTAIRHDMHAHPELGLEEFRTSALVAAKLREWGLEVVEKIGFTGVVGTLRGSRNSPKSMGLRAPMDALPITEQNEASHVSLFPGRMHARGHDGQTAMLLGAARFLAGKPDFAGTVHFIFQPGAEGRGGSSMMIRDGLFERFVCDAVYGMHAVPDLPAGFFSIKSGPTMAGLGRFSVTFHGPGDLAVMQAKFVLELQRFANDELQPEGATVRVGRINAEDGPAQVLSASAKVVGTTRCFTAEMHARIGQHMVEAARRIASGSHATASVRFETITPQLINPAGHAELAMQAATEVVESSRVIWMEEPVTAGEDFAFMLEQRPGAFIFLGNGVSKNETVDELRTELPPPQYDFNDEIIPAGVSYWVKLVTRRLSAPEDSGA